MKVLDFSFCFFIGFVSGAAYFHHLFISSKKAILEKRKSTGFIFRFLPFALVCVSVAYFFKEGIFLFLVGFYLSRLVYTKKVIQVKWDGG